MLSRGLAAAVRHSSCHPLSGMANVCKRRPTSWHAAPNFTPTSAKRPRMSATRVQALAKKSKRWTGVPIAVAIAPTCAVRWRFDFAIKKTDGNRAAFRAPRFLWYCRFEELSQTVNSEIVRLPPIPLLGILELGGKYGSRSRLRHDRRGEPVSQG